MSNKEPNVSLTETQNALLQHRLTSYLSDLHTTLVHLPYTWMIEKELQGLDEEGGSMEDLISKFIKKEHYCLPRAHLTLLNNQLQKMKEKGEILMIDGGRFLLPGHSRNSKEKKEDAQDEGQVMEAKDKHRGRGRKGKEGRDDPYTILLKDL